VLCTFVNNAAIAATNIIAAIAAIFGMQRQSRIIFVKLKKYRKSKVQSTVIYTETWQACKQGCLVLVILSEYKFNYIFVALFSSAVEVYLA